MKTALAKTDCRLNMLAAKLILCSVPTGGFNDPQRNQHVTFCLGVQCKNGKAPKNVPVRTLVED